ncbi:MAG: EamA family transporter [Anaerolineae bacterium]|nr:EamA family transporter [Anaerolineae bacterium]
MRLTTLAADSAQRTGITLVLVGAFCFSLAIPFTRWTDGLSTSTIAFFRALFGFLFLCALTIASRTPVRQALSWDTIRRLVPLGLVVSATVILYTYAVQHTTAANAVLLVNSAPIYVAVLAPLLLGEPRARYTWQSLALAFIGMALMTDPARLDVRSSELSGIVAAALSGACYSLVMLISRSLRGRISGLTQNLWSNGTIVLVLLPWALRAPGAVVVSNLHLLIPLGIFSLGLSYLFYFQGLQRISAQQVSIASLAEPIFGVLMGLAFFAEVPNTLGWIGAALILTSITLITR